MSSFHKQVTIRYTAELMYDLVNDINAYSNNFAIQWLNHFANRPQSVMVLEINSHQFLILINKDKLVSSKAELFGLFN